MKAFLFRFLIAMLIATLALPNIHTQNAVAQSGFSCDNVTEIPRMQCDNLVSLYSYTDGSNWTNHTNWLVTNTPSNWYGVSVSFGQVVGLNLAYNNLNYYLPNGFVFTWIQNINLSGNSLSGTIPISWWGVPDLKYLDLSGNSFSGSIPYSLTQLSKLKDLRLGYNNLSGTIPDELGSLTQLEELYLNDNQMSGPIPASFLQLRNLNLFFFQNDLPRYNNTICEPPSAAFVVWKSGVPRWNGTGLTCANNTAPNLNGLANATTRPATPVTVPFTVTDDFTSAANLTLSAASANTTLIPSANLSLGGSGRDRTLTITPAAGQTGSTTLTITVSDDAPGGALSNSASFTLTVTPFTCADISEIPPAECQALAAIYNQTGGPAWINRSNWWGTTTPSNWFGVGVAGGHVNLLDFFNNNLTGSIPAEIGALTYLEYFKLNSDPIGGPIPPEFGNLVNLKYAYILNSNLSGAIPMSVTRMSPIAFDFANTQLCEPPTQVFTAWKAAIPAWSSTGQTCANHAPTISDLPNATTPHNTAITLPFNVGDDFTPAGNLSVSAVSSNPTLVPDLNMTFAGSGANRTVTITPASGQAGIVTLTMSVADDAGSPLTASDSFLLVIGGQKRVDLTGFTLGTAMPFGAFCGQITFDSGTPPDNLRVVMNYGYPTANQNSLPHWYEITATGGSSWLAHLQLCYEDNELHIASIPDKESTLQLYRSLGSGVWQAYTATVDTANNTVTAANIDGFSAWTIGVGMGPTAVGLSQLRGYAANSEFPVGPGILLVLVALGVVVRRALA